MAGYTRQSLATIINGADITAPPLNSEFNQILAAFNATTGHAHDGSTGNAPKINLTTSVSGYLPAAHGGIGGKNKFDATSAPATSNDAGEGYAPGSMWENTTNGRMYICVGNTSNAAVWRELVTVISDNQITPISTDSIDLGTPSIRFQDAYLSGGLSAAGNISAGGNLIVTGTAAVTGDATFANLSATGTTTITSVDLNSGAIDNSAIGTTTPAAGTFTTLAANTSLTAATADINGGSIDNATIGSSTPSTASFTTLGASGTSTLATVDINAGNIDNTVIGASTAAAGSFTTISSTGNATLATADINGGSIDGAVIGANSAAAITGTTITGTSFVGPITGAVTGNVTGNVTGAVTGNVTGDLTGNVTAGSGSSSFNNVTISGTLNMDANSAATITNLSAPTNNNDAARKIDVDNAVANLVDSAPDSLNTLNELAAALNDDDDAFNTLNTAIGTKLPKAGGTMTGAIAMGTNKITGAGDPTAAQDLSTKSYTDTQRDTRVAKSGDTMSGALAMGSNKITGLGTPTAGTDATTKTYVDGILGSATVAATSATNAATSESNAATSATNASNSATAAANSATSAAASLDSFDDRYLGAKSSAPTVDNDGDALIVGALYFDSTAGAMKVYSANGWTNAGSSVNGTTNRYSYTATAGQTVFAATYDAGYVDVFLNGVKQLVGTDVTATSGTSVVFASGTTVNDIVEIVGYGTFVLADHLTQTQSDARYVNLSGDAMTGNLSVGGTITASGIGGFNDYIDLNTAGNRGKVGFDSNNVYIGSTSSTGEIHFKNNIGSTDAPHSSGDTKMVITDSGVGIGASPSTRLTVGAGAGTEEIRVDAGAGWADLTLNSNSTNGGHIYFNDGSNAGEIFYYHPSDYMAFNTAATERMRISSAGDVELIQSNNLYWKHQGGGTIRAGITADSSDNLTFSTGSSDTTRMTIDTSGNVIANSGSLNLVGTNTQIFASSNGDDIQFKFSGTKKASINNGGLISASDGSEVVPGFRFVDDPNTGMYRSASDTISFSTAGSERMRIRPDGAVRIYDSGQLGDTSGTPLILGNKNVSKQMEIGVNDSALTNPYITIIGRNSGNSTARSMSIGVQADSQYSYITDSNNSNDFRIYAGGNVVPSGNVVMGNGQGIDFSATANGSGTTTSELLDDYEEGTWTPSVSNGTISYLHNRYTKIGRQVTVSAFIYNISDQTTTAAFAINGLPFTTSASSRTTGSVMVRYSNNTSITAAYSTASTTAVEFYGVTSASWDVLQYSDFNSASAEVYFTISYTV